MIKKKIVVASSNKGKIAEIKEILSNCEIITLEELENFIGKKLIITETQDTFELNALEKVNCLYD